MTVSYFLECTSDGSASYDLISNKGIENYSEDYSIKMIMKEQLMSDFLTGCVPLKKLVLCRQYISIRSVQQLFLLHSAQ